MTGIERAIEAAGSAEELGRQLGVTGQFIHKSKNKGYLPVDRARTAAELHGIPLVDLVRSDVASAIRATR